MTGARDAVLARIREALADREAPPDVPRRYHTGGGSSSPDELAHGFEARVAETGAMLVAAPNAPAAVEAILAGQGARRVVVSSDLSAELRPRSVEVVEDRGLSPIELEELDGAVTTCAIACADTGTIALDGGPGQGRRALTLIPDLHVCLVRRDQLVGTVPELVERLAPAARAGRPIVLVTGPSASVDIGFERVEGVHGPRRLVVVLTG